MGWTEDALDFVLLCEDCFHPALTARNCIVLHKKYTVLFACDVMSCIDLQVWVLIPHVRNFKLVVDEILAFPVATK
jgi:hypothetical protein